jgi:T6SS, Transcription factor, DNA binding domain
MPAPPLDPDVAEVAPTDPDLTVYDKEHVVTYLRILDAAADNADWRDVARLVLHIDPTKQPNRARTAYEMHLARAKWMSSYGYQSLLRKGD